MKTEEDFKEKFSGILITKLPSIAESDNVVGNVRHFTESIDCSKVNKFCEKQKVAPANLFIGGLGICLGKYTREEKLAFCVTLQGQSEKEIINDIGLNVSDMLFFLEVKSEQKVNDYLSSIESEYWERQSRLLSESKVNTDVASGIHYAFQKDDSGNLLTDGEKVSGEDMNNVSVSDRIILVIKAIPEHYEISIDFNDKIFEPELIRSFANSLKNAVSNMTDSADLDCGNVSLLDKEEEQEVLQISHGEKLEFNESSTMVDLFKQQVDKTPGKIAVVYQDKSYTYKQIDEISDKIARKLVSIGVGRESIVGVMIDRSEYMMIYSLSVIKAGAAYMPLDYSMPRDRLSYMIKDAGVKIILSEDKRVETLLPDFDGEVIHKEDLEKMVVDENIIIESPTPDNMFIVLYTSGTTGLPKGCILEHRNLVNFCICNFKVVYRITSDDKCAAYANYSFDAHLIDLYQVVFGATVYIIPSSKRLDLVWINNYIEENCITTVFFTTQIGKSFIENFQNKSLRILGVGGERLTATKKPGYEFLNAYGPTECTIFSTYKLITEDYTGSSIGHSLGNCSNYILDKDLQPLPLGVDGEICIGGRGVSRGYLNRDELNSQKFPLWRGERIYRTGDRGRLKSNGEIEYVGRMDNQVKLRGLRIEPGEIENRLASFDGISMTAVDVKEIAGAQQLCGYFTSKTKIDTVALRSYLAETLTEFMIPAVLMQLETMPLTNNGKVDRKALPVPDISSSAEYIAPGNKFEEDICSVFSNVLMLEKVGIMDDFFQIGGTSILAIKAIIEIINLGHQVDYGDLFRLKTPLEIARLIAQRTDDMNYKQGANDDDITKYDYTAINEVLANTKVDLWNDFVSEQTGTILLTGATGYLGIHVLKELIDHRDGVIYCLIRSSGLLTAESRLKAKLMYYFSDPYDNLFGTRIIPVNGDLTEISSLDALKGKGIDTVFNCAASVKHFAAGDELENINFIGVINLVNFCKAENARLVHISTISIGGSVKVSENSIPEIDESKLYIGQDVSNPYVNTKFRAERAILQEVSQGFPGKIIRVGELLSRQSDGEFQINFKSNAFVNMIKAYKVMKMFPLSQLNTPVEIAPIDSTAAAVVVLSGTPRKSVVFNAYNSYGLFMANIMYAFREYGFHIEFVSDEEFNRNFDEMMKNNSKSEYLSGLFYYGINSRGYIITPTENSFTTTMLYRYDFRWPLTGDDYSAKLIKMLDGLGFFDEN